MEFLEELVEQLSGVEPERTSQHDEDRDARHSSAALKDVPIVRRDPCAPSRFFAGDPEAPTKLGDEFADAFGDLRATVPERHSDRSSHGTERKPKIDLVGAVTR